MDYKKIEAVKNLIIPNIRANRVVKVTFHKKDNSLREMTLMRSKKLEDSMLGTTPEATAARQWTLKKNGMMTVEELTADKKFQWRTLNCGTVETVVCNGKTYVFV